MGVAVQSGCCVVLVEQWAFLFNDHRDAGKFLWTINKSLGPWIL